MHALSKLYTNKLYMHEILKFILLYTLAIQFVVGIEQRCVCEIH